MRLCPIVATWLATACFWSCFVGCLAPPAPEPSPTARIIVAWDPLACTGAHRVAVELETELGHELSRSSRCVDGSITLDAPYWGTYIGRVYAWRGATDGAGEPGTTAEISAETTLTLAIDAPIVRWYLTATPN